MLQVIEILYYLGKSSSQQENQLSRMRGNTRSSTKTLMEIKKKKSILLVDEVLDWLQICTVSSSLDVKGNKAIQKTFVFLANLLVFPNTVTYMSRLRKQRVLMVQTLINTGYTL